ncbi:MAG TPA: sugar transferase [Terriglobales bacterium]|nr:sugar transferase [Terriglobales bacterium]
MVQAANDAIPELQLVLPKAERTAAVHFRHSILACEVLADLFAITFAVRFGYFTYVALHIGKHFYFSPTVIWVAGVVFSAVLVLMLDRVGAYRRGNSLLRVRETEQILRVSAEALLIVLAFSFFGKIIVPRLLLVLCVSFVPLFLFVEKNLIYLLVYGLHSRGHGNERVLIYGAGCTGRRVFSVLRASPKLGLVPVAVVDDDPEKVGGALFEMAYERRGSAHIVHGPVTREMLAQRSIDMVIIAIPTIERHRFVATVEECLAAGTRVSFVPSQLMSSDGWLDYRDVDGLLLASFGRPASRLGYEFSKRVFDLVGALALIVLGSPLFAVLAAIIKIDSRGPVLFKQQRIGLNGRPFLMYKFRTMKTNAAAYEQSPRESCDPRITRVGRFLRKTSFDELPQLLNVLQGTMSLVGPRPEMPFIVSQYTGRHRQRLQVKPGLTGLWQLSGDRAFLIHENIEYDLYYIRHRNIFMDLAVLLHTSIFAMRGI